MPLPLDPAAADAHHLLVLPEDVAAEELDVLATSRFPHARWERLPDAVDLRGRRRVGPGLLRLTRLSTLEGPYRVPREVRGPLGLPPAGADAYLVRGPRERGTAPWPGAADPDGLARAFPGGLPVRDEERVVAWLVDAARRLGGAVRVADSAAVLVPDPGAAVDLTVWSDVWLDPEAGLAVVRQAVPRARLDLGEFWAGPPDGTGTVPVPGTEDMPAAERAALHAAADERDLRALGSPDRRSAYGLLADLEPDGMLAVQVGGESDVPLVLGQVPWAGNGAIAYRVSWEPDDLADLGVERPPVGHRIARGRTAPLVAAVARAVQAAVGGEVVDAMGFVVDPADL